MGQFVLSVIILSALTKIPTFGFETFLEIESLLDQISPAPIPTLPGLLYPRESETREIKSLDGLWDFAYSSQESSKKGYQENWFLYELSASTDVIQMPVPSSYNDITTSPELRDYVGPVWYEKSFFVPQSWSKKRVFLRFGSVNYLAQVWINGVLVMKHEIGHLPFEEEISSYLIFGGKNRVTVAVDNTLLQTTVPQGTISDIPTDNGTIPIQYYDFDFFNYAGIHRPVLLHTKPRVYIEDITIKTSVHENSGTIKYKITPNGLNDDETAVCKIKLLESDGTVVTEKLVDDLSGKLKIANPKLWWAIGMDPNPGYLYTLELTLSAKSVINNATITEEFDVYRLPIGIRTIKYTNTSLLLNDKPIYMRGFGRHEDSVIRGRGLDLVTMVRDYHLLKWVGANAYRTSHYPYSDEVMDMADREGIMIIDECPSVDTVNFSTTLLEKHKTSLSELIRRDKNRPSVIMWSIANEPRSQLADADAYFKQIATHTKSVDPTRPITAALARSVTEDKAGQYLDVISFNRYNSWYSNSGRLDMITERVINEAEAWNQKHDKPVLMSEYGADTMPGLHELPAYVWSEEYQTQMLSKHFLAFDYLRQQNWFIGEFIWNFADFRTAQSYMRVGGNKKGIFTRSREPKMAAHHVRRRYHSLGWEIDGEKMPDNLRNYISTSFEF